MKAQAPSRRNDSSQLHRYRLSRGEFRGSQVPKFQIDLQTSKDGRKEPVRYGTNDLTRSALRPNLLVCRLVYQTQINEGWQFPNFKQVCRKRGRTKLCDSVTLLSDEPQGTEHNALPSPKSA